MFRKIFSGAGLLLLAGAVVLMTPASSRAQHGHFGGAHFGGSHFAGAHFGGYHGGYSNGGYHYGYGHHHPYYGYRHDYGLFPSFGYGYSPAYGSYSDYAADAAVDPGYGGDYTAVAPDAVNDTPVTPPAAGSPSYYASATGTVEPDDVAHITVNVPADAKVWFEGALMTSTGSFRRYDSPPLAPGSRYAYDVQASWNENGHEVTQTQKVDVTAGGHANVAFPVPSRTAAEGSASSHS